MTRQQLTSTYRLQMNARFTLADARSRIDYFERLGVSHLYLSPILAARRGSMHGYDVVDPTRINPEVGTEAQLRALSEDLHRRGMGILLDIVPNHMNTSAENPYWNDVLSHGERSRYARWFDIDWNRGSGPAHKVVLPILADELDRVIDRGEIAISIGDAHTPRLSIAGTTLPLDPASLPEELQLAQLDPEEARELAAEYSHTGGRDRLRSLLDAQHYRLVFWRRGAREINYRRFFDVNDLVALRAEDPAVFHETHALILRLVREDVIDGLRIDHIDGLLNPSAYLDRLRAEVGDDVPIVVEKILAIDEELSPSWPVDGTTGYEFLNDVDDLFIDPNGFAEIERYYRTLRRLGDTAFKDIARAGKAAALAGPLSSDIERITTILDEIARAAGRHRPRADLSAALVEFISALPVYRTDLAPGAEIRDDDRAVITETSKDGPAADSPGWINAFIAKVLLSAEGGDESEPAVQFAQRLQQVSGPATAKGVEDTALYVYVPLASRNEVGGAPDRPLENAVARFHENNERRAASHPLSLVTTNTHDAKRSADARSRIEALSEIAHEWERSLRRWRRLTGKHRETIRGRLAPDTNTEYLFYQTLIALWPSPRPGRRTDDLPDRAWRDSARDRLLGYMQKAAREAKARTSWVEPNAEFEDAILRFVRANLEPSEDAPFLSDVARLVTRIAPIGASNAIARLVLHLTSPGTPDIYQGDEFWNFALVDPDNRGLVDYDARERALDDLDAIASRLRGSASLDVFDNRVKLFVTKQLLALRKSRSELFTRGSYRPLEVRGRRAEHVVAFMRNNAEQISVSIAARLTNELLASRGSEWWEDTSVLLPPDFTVATMTSAITGEELRISDATIRVAHILAKLPAAVATN
jgi:(1->4)-alpha-D-glucan 1-alpha-D-glucosylmutase